MLYNDFNGISLSRLGFGCMRFATDPDTGEVNQETVEAMLPAETASSPRTE